MKKWNKPQLLSLGVENTFTGDCDCSIGGFGSDSVGAYAKHPCHKTGNGDHNDNGNHGEDNGNGGIANPGQNGHVISTDCTTHTFCCCYNAPAQS